MAYADRFQLADDLINHLQSTIGGVTDPFLKSRYAGFVAVASVTVYELAIKDIFIAFAEKKGRSCGAFVSSTFERLNGRIKTSVIRGEHVPRFGERYVKRYKKSEKELEQRSLRDKGVSVLTAYNNVIQWRHLFTHQGQVPSTATFEEVVQSYEIGKEVVHCLARVMVR